MPWCPNCREEYREGFTKCGECQSDLVGELEPQKPQIWDIPEHPDTPVYLMTAEDNLHATAIEGLLKSYDIPILKKPREAGDYVNVYMAVNIFGIDIFVPSSALEQAQEILKSDIEPSFEEIEQNAEDQQEEQEAKDWAVYANRKRFASWLITCILCFGILSGLAFMIVDYLRP